MRPDNPAVYECPKGRGNVHTWERTSDGGARCVNCDARLTPAQADDCFTDFARRG